MIYGNKFLNYGIDTTNIFDVMSTDIAFIESLNIENELVTESTKDVLFKIFDHIKDILRRLVNVCKKVINIIKSKILIAENKLLGLLDDCLHGKHIPLDFDDDFFDDDFFDEEVEEIFEDDDGEFIVVQKEKVKESFIIQESESSNNIITLCGCSNSIFYNDIFDYDSTANIFDLVDKYLKAIEKDDMDKASEFIDEYDDKYKQRINKIIEDGTEDIKTFKLKFDDFKSHKGTEYKPDGINSDFWWDIINVNDKTALQCARDHIRTHLNTNIDRNKWYTNSLNKTIDWDRKIKYITDRTKSITNSVSSMTKITPILNDLSRAASIQYKLLSLDIKTQFYETKVNFANTIKLVKLFTKNRNKEENYREDSDED